MPLARSVLGGAAIGLVAMAAPSHGFAAQSTMLRPASLGLRMVGTVSAPPAQKMSTEVVTEQKQQAPVPKKNSLQQTGELVSEILGAHFKPLSKVDVQLPPPQEARRMVVGRKGDSDRGSPAPMFRSPGRNNELVKSHAWEANESLNTDFERREGAVLNAVGGNPVGVVSTMAVRKLREVGLLVWSVFAAHIAAVLAPMQAAVLTKPPGYKPPGETYQPKTRGTGGFSYADRAKAAIAGTKPAVAVPAPYTGPPAHAPAAAPAPAAPAPAAAPARAAGVGGDVNDVLARVRAMETGGAPPPSVAPPQPVTSVTPPAYGAPAPLSSPSSAVDDVLARVQAMEGSRLPSAAPPSAPAAAPSSSSSPPPAAAAPSAPPGGNDVASVMARLRAMEEAAGK